MKEVILSSLCRSVNGQVRMKTRTRRSSPRAWRRRPRLKRRSKPRVMTMGRRESRRGEFLDSGWLSLKMLRCWRKWCRQVELIIVHCPHIWSCVLSATNVGHWAVIYCSVRACLIPISPMASEQRWVARCLCFYFFLLIWHISFRTMMSHCSNFCKMSRSHSGAEYRWNWT